MFIILSTIVFLIGLFIIFKGGLDSFEIGFLIIMISIFFGYGVLCTLVPVKTREEITIPKEVFISENYVVVIYQDKLIKTERAKIVNKATKENIKLKLTHQINSYGFETGYDAKIVIEKETK